MTAARKGALLAGALALVAGAAGLWAERPALARAWRKLTPRRPPDRWGGPLVPAPLVSRGKPVFTHPPVPARGGKRLTDGVYRAGAWDGGFPTPEKPAWAAVRIGGGYRRVLFVWTSSHNHDWDERFYGAPADYRLETSADSTDGSDGSWRVALAVTDNPARIRAHAVDMAGQRWIRMVVTRLPAKVNEWGLHLDQLDVHDLSDGGNDVWIFLGDSITAGVFDRASPRQPSFAAWVARAHAAYFPAMIEAGKGAIHTDQMVGWARQVLALNPDARVVAIGIGSNDWDPVAYERDLTTIVREVKAAGKIAMVARMPWRSDNAGGQDFQARLNEVVDRVTRAEGLLPGPDLYAYTKGHPERLTDHLHTDDQGAVAISRLWAEAADPLYE